ncbi:MAG: beta-galactosidase [Lautropia sp.]|nr:beta-galactosidase [Lautropia sp.]
MSRDSIVAQPILNLHAPARWAGKRLPLLTALLLACHLPLASAQLVADPGLSGTALPKEVIPYRLDQEGSSAPRQSPADRDGFVTLTFGAGKTEQPPSWLIIRPQNGSWNWQAVKSLRMHLQNIMPWAVTLLVQVTDTQGHSLQSTLALPPGPPFALAMPLSALQPLQMGMRSGPPIPWTTGGAISGLAESVTGTLDVQHVNEIRIGMPVPDAEQKIRLGKIFLPPIGSDDVQLAYTGIVDGYGQYSRLDWPGKYHAPRRLVQALAEFAPSGMHATATHRHAHGNTSPRLQARRTQAYRDAEDAVRADFAQFVHRADQKLEHDLKALRDEQTPAPGATDSSPGQVPAASQDRYGGLSGIPGGGKGTGWFTTGRLILRDGSRRHILLTPEGNPFFSLGVNAIQRDNSETFVSGREFQFTDLPNASSPEHRFFKQRDSTDELPADSGAQAGRNFLKGQTFDFYQANLFRRDGKDWPQRWVTRTGKRLKGWGFNTVGAWSDTSMDHVRLPYTRIAHIIGPFARLSDGNNWWQGIPDAFDPAFARAVDQTLQKETAGSHDDPWLIGWFVDNELGWGNGSSADPHQRYALAYSALAMDAAQPQAHAKRALVALLRDRYNNNLPELARVWQRPLASWQAVEAAWTPAQLPDGNNPQVAADLSAFLRLHANAYYSRVASALKKYAPHHLYLGSRLAGRTPEAVAACARWCDVISFNLYIPSLQEGFEAEEFARLDKPALLTEFHFGSADRGPFWPGVMSVNTEAERSPAYRRMLESVLASHQFVGAHWFQYLDQPVTGRWLDGENGHLGLVGITDIPWHDFVLSVARTHANILTALRAQSSRVQEASATPPPSAD